MPSVSSLSDVLHTGFLSAVEDFLRYSEYEFICY